jgi:hypothetical protein
MDEDKIILNHKLQNLLRFINNSSIKIEDLEEIAFKIDLNFKCEKCFQDYNNFQKVNIPIQSISEKKNINIRESIKFFQNKGILNDNLLEKYNKFRMRFVNGAFDYCHHNTLISFNKLEQLLKTKIKKNYKDVFENIKYNFSDFYSCPHFEKPIQKVKIDLSKIINICPPVPNKNATNKPLEFVNDLTSESKTVSNPVWEIKKIDYKNYKFEKKNIKVISKPIFKELYVKYNKFLLQDILNIKIDLDYVIEKENLVSKLEKLQIYSNLEPYNYLIENQLYKVQRKIENDYSDNYLNSSLELKKNIENLINKNINHFIDDENIDSSLEIYNLDKLIELIKELKYNIYFGKELIEICNIVNYSKYQKVKNKLEDYNDIYHSLLKKYKKIKLNCKDDTNINNQSLVHLH